MYLDNNYYAECEKAENLLNILAEIAHKYNLLPENSLHNYHLQILSISIQLTRFIFWEKEQIWLNGQNGMVFLN